MNASTEYTANAEFNFLTGKGAWRKNKTEFDIGCVSCCVKFPDVIMTTEYCGLCNAAIADDVIKFAPNCSQCEKKICPHCENVSEGFLFCKKHSDKKYKKSIEEDINSDTDSIVASDDGSYESAVLYDSDYFKSVTDPEYEDVDIKKSPSRKLIATESKAINSSVGEFFVDGYNPICEKPGCVQERIFNGKYCKFHELYVGRGYNQQKLDLYQPKINIEDAKKNNEEYLSRLRKLLENSPDFVSDIIKREIDRTEKSLFTVPEKVQEDFNRMLSYRISMYYDSEEALSVDTPSSDIKSIRAKFYRGTEQSELSIYNKPVRIFDEETRRSVSFSPPLTYNKIPIISPKVSRFTKIRENLLESSPPKEEKKPRVSDLPEPENNVDAELMKESLIKSAGELIDKYEKAEEEKKLQEEKEKREEENLKRISNAISAETTSRMLKFMKISFPEKKDTAALTIALQSMRSEMDKQSITINLLLKMLEGARREIADVSAKCSSLEQQLECGKTFRR